MNRRPPWGALFAGTVLSLLVVGFWSVSPAVTMNPAPPLHLDWRHHPFASYLALAGAPAGNGPGLFAVLSVSYAPVPADPRLA